LRSFDTIDRTLNVGILGYGRVASFHIKALEHFPDNLKFTAVCDLNESVRKKVSEEFKVKAYACYEEMLADPEIDLITLCTPSGLHAGQVIQAARAGKHVITEKPMATRWQDGVDMIKACDEAGVRLFVVKQNRYNETLQLLKQAVMDNRFGKIYMANLNVYWHRTQDYYDLADWRGTWEFDGGAMMNQASHYMDLLRWLVGPVDRVHAMMSTLARQIEVEDTAVLNIRWRSGTLGSVNITNLVHDKDYEGSITLIGETGRVKIGGKALNKVEDWVFETEHDSDKKVFDSNYETDSVYGFGHIHYYQNVIDVFQGKASPETDGREGLKTLELLIAAYQSARDHREVGLPLVL
jgi:UDP-N-acetyl-2-amino-2-deoxyglucuronate dehydrogenase